MKNFEKYENEVKEIYGREDHIAVVNGKPISCYGLELCDKCDFYKKGDCEKRRIEWLYSEYKEPIKLSRLEYEILKKAKEFQYKYIARDENGNLYAYQDQPKKNGDYWSDGCFTGSYIADWLFCFKFVKWEDEEPYSIDELMKCEVVDDED